MTCKGTPDKIPEIEQTYAKPNSLGGPDKPLNCYVPYCPSINKKTAR